MLENRIAQHFFQRLVRGRAGFRHGDAKHIPIALHMKADLLAFVLTIHLKQVEVLDIHRMKGKLNIISV